MRSVDERHGSATWVNTMAERRRATRFAAALAAVAAAIALLSPASRSAAADERSTPTASPIAADQRRGVEQTLLTYPEWFLVHSPAEYARDVAVHPSHDFPFVGHVAQLWEGYADVTREQMRRGDPANLGYHAMIVVIATSTTIEYLLRAAYENTIGRLGWALSSGRATAEDRFQATVAEAYVDFIRREPWYLYDFGGRLKQLWTAVPMTGDDPLRKWERRYALTTEYAVKAVYAKLIERATRAGYEPALMTTQVVADRAPPHPVAEVRTLRALPAGSRVLFVEPLLPMPGTRRVAALMPVAALSTFLATATAHGLVVEHVYDY